jgi:hypothetical protein
LNSEGGSLGGTHSAWGVAGATGSIFTEGDCGSYGVNRWLQTKWPGGFNAWKAIDVAGGEIIPMFGGSWWYGAQPKHTDSPPPYEGVFDSSSHGSGQYMERVCVNRHEGFVNHVFMDLSARKVGLKSLWRLKWNREYDLDYPLPDLEREAPWMVDFPDPE